MTEIAFFLIVTTFPLWVCLIYVKFVFDDDIANYFDGMSPKIALAAYVLFILLFHFTPNIFPAQLASDTIWYSRRLFTTIPSIATAMILFPEVFMELHGKNAKKVMSSAYRKVYRGAGWLFLIVVIVTAITL